MHSTPPVTIRPASADDAESLRRLAILDSAPDVPDGPLLLAEVEGELHAALALWTGAVIADPFRPTVALVGLLRAHASRPESAEGWRRRRLRLRSPVVLGSAHPAA